MNRIILIGRLTKDIKLDYTNEKKFPIATGSLAVDDYNTWSKEIETDFFNFRIFGKRAEAAANYTKKGDFIGISGKMKNRSYIAKDGVKKYYQEIEIEDFDFISNGKNNSENINSNELENSERLEWPFTNYDE